MKVPLARRIMILTKLTSMSENLSLTKTELQWPVGPFFFHFFIDGNIKVLYSRYVGIE